MTVGPPRQLIGGFLVVVLICASCVSAETYKELPLGEKFRGVGGVNAFKTRKNKVLKGSESLAVGGDTMRAYYQQYLLPAMTRTDQRAKVADLRNEVITDLAQATVPPARDEVYKMVFRYARTISTNDKYHPAARYNYLLLLGQLNSKESINNQPPMPDERVLRYLIGPLRSKDGPEMLRYAAMIGLIRHAAIRGPKSPQQFPAKVRAGLARIVLPIATDAEAPSAADPAAHNWLRSRAVEVLGHLRYVGDGSVVQELSNLLLDEQAGFDVRCAAAEALGRIAPNLGDASAADLAGRMAKLAVDASNAESRILWEISNQNQDGRNRVYRPSTPRGGDGLPDLDGDPTDRRRARNEVELADQRTLASRRRHLFQLLSIRKGLAGDAKFGINGLVTLKDSKTQVDPVLSHVNAMIAAIEDVESDINKLGGKLLSERRALSKLIPAALVAPAAEKDMMADEPAAAAAEEAAADATPAMVAPADETPAEAATADAGAAEAATAEAASANE